MQSVNSYKHFEISYSRFWTIVTRTAIESFQIPFMKDVILSFVATFHTTMIIITNSSKYPFTGSILESMYRCVSSKSNVIADYRKLPPKGPRQLTTEMQATLEAVEKPAKRGKMPDTKKVDIEGPSPSCSDHNEEQSVDEEEAVHHDSSPRGNTPPQSLTPEVNPNDSVPTPPQSPPQSTVPVSVAPISLPHTT